MCMCVGVHVILYVLRSEDFSQKSVRFSHAVGVRAWIQIIRLDSKFPYLLEHLATWTLGILRQWNLFYELYSLHLSNAMK